MPYSVIKVSPKCWSVINSETEKVHAKCTTKKNAEAQMRLLYGLESGKWKPASTYREFVAAKFKSRPAGMKASEWMKEIGQMWRDMKSK